MRDNVLHQAGDFRVTENLLVTPRKTYVLDRVEYVSVTRPLILFVGGPALGVIGFSGAFWRYLSVTEIVVLLMAAATALAAASIFGTLRIHSMALREDEVALSFGFVSRLREVRRAVEQVMASRADKEFRS